ncbi:MAG: DUF4340 domain-containing protein [Alphaproteobacteria bacterium]|nr:DUF4340 domain-containing protein [Alphaproteobacteria bacterium]
MAETAGPLVRRRRRQLAWLGLAALVSVLLAILSLRAQEQELVPKYMPETFLPGFAAKLGLSWDIRISSRNGSFDVRRMQDRWVLPGRGNYPAALDLVQKTLVGLAALETIEPKTDQPSLYRYLDLDGPPRGAGIVIEVADGKGHLLAGIVAGKTADIGDPGGNVGLYVRRLGDRQSWLVRSVFQPARTIGEWTDKTVVNIDRARIREEDVTPQGTPAYVLKRDTPSDPDFKPSILSKGRELANESAADAVASFLSDFTFDDVRAAKTMDFSNALPQRTLTFDGLVVTTRVTRQGPQTWLEFSADADPRKPDAQKEASEINAHAAGWAYMLSPSKAQEIAPSLESLLKPPEQPAKTAQ